MLGCAFETLLISLHSFYSLHLASNEATLLRAVPRIENIGNSEISKENYHFPTLKFEMVSGLSMKYQF